MKIKMENGYIYIIEANVTQTIVLKSLSEMKWDKKMQCWVGAASLDVLDKLAGFIPLPKIIMAERDHLKAVQDAVDAERVKAAENVKPMVDYPVKRKLYTHQVRAANMCLLTFGLAKPP